MWLILLLAFDPRATSVALMEPATRREALRVLEGLDGAALETARAEGLHDLVFRIAVHEGLPAGERILAVRALGRLGGRLGITALQDMVRGHSSPTAVALARESARALARLGVLDAQGSGATSPDPEVREITAQTGAAPHRQCALLGDPWPQVRVAAARGLAHLPAHAACLADALADPDPRVQGAAARAAGAVARPELRAPLRALAGRADGPLEARAEAFVALAALGDLEPAERALAAHLEKGGIEPLARAAIRALATRGTPVDRERLRAALDSTSPAVRAAAGRALVELGDEAALPLIRARLGDTPGLREVVVPPAEADPADADPE